MRDGPTTSELRDHFFQEIGLGCYPTEALEDHDDRAGLLQPWMSDERQL